MRNEYKTQQKKWNFISACWSVMGFEARVLSILASLAIIVTIADKLILK